FPSTPVYPHGICVVPTTGALGATPTGASCLDPQACIPGDKCTYTALPPGAESACTTVIPSTVAASCLQMCDPAASAGAPGACPSGLTCQHDFDTPGKPSAGSCDLYTINWGVCRM